MRSAFWLCIALALLFQSGCKPNQEQSNIVEIARHRNLALAYLEENQLKEAEAEFKKLIEFAPEEAFGYANLGVTYLRMGKHEEAESQTRRALAKSNDADIRLILAEIYEKSGRSNQSLQVLGETVTKNPLHYRSQYKMAQLLMRSGKPGAEAHLLKVLEAQPGNIMAKLQLVEVLMRSGKGETAAVHLDEARAQAFELSDEQTEYFRKAFQLAQQSDSKEALPAAIAFHNLIKPTPLYQASVIDLIGPGAPFVGFPITHPRGLLAWQSMKQPVVRFQEVPAEFAIGSHLALGDYDGDEDPDIYIGGVLYSNDRGKFTQNVRLEQAGKAAAFFDSNNDGHHDLLTLSSTGVSLYENDTNGKFLKPTTLLESSAANLFIVDLDSDGDLDVLLPGDEKSYALRNNLDGSFVDFSKTAGLSSAGSSAVFGDFDEDGDLDIVVANAAGENLLYSNLRQGRFQQMHASLGRNSQNVAAGDFNNDGFLDLFFTGTKPALHRNRGNGTFQEVLHSNWPEASDAAFLDFDNDGFLDLLIAGKETRLFRNAGQLEFAAQNLLPSSLPEMRKVAVADYDGDGDPDLFLLPTTGKLRVFRNEGGNTNRWLNVRLRGLGAGSGKNNRFGIGARVEVKTGNLYQMRVADQPVVHFGLGSHEKADVVRVVWTNGVPQNHFQPASNQTVVETQILKGSCPFLYAWDGKEYAFVTDIMWKSALGMPVVSNAGDTVYAFPNSSDEYLKVPGDALRAKDGHYSLQITEELWETSYLDQTALVTLDHPEGTHLYIDERFVTPPYPPLKIYGVRKKFSPLSAVDENGRDVLPLIRKKDDKFVTGFISGRYQGTTQLHDLVVDLGRHPVGSKIVLFLNGWVFPGDASINFARLQHAKTISPYIEVADGRGGWRPAVPNLSFPMGKNKMVIADLTGKFLSTDHRIRIRTNMQIYWDYVFYSKDEAPVDVVKTRLRAASADLHYRGFSRMYRKGFYGPHWFDYNDVTKEPKWRDLVGFYTKYGDVTPLLQNSDNKYVIMNAGDELSISFDATQAPDLRNGWTRDFLLYSDGWIKDGDFNTAHSNTVEPLPFHGMKSYPYAKGEGYPADAEHTRYRKEYNTRYVP